MAPLGNAPARFVASALALVLATGCLTLGGPDSEYPEQPPAQSQPVDPHAPAPGQYAGQYAGPPQAQPAQPQAAPWQAPAIPPPNPHDPINTIDRDWLRNKAGIVLAELINALPPVENGRVRDIPLRADPTVGEVNAFAACDENRVAVMAISDGLLDIQAHMAQFRATDEVFGTRKLDGYFAMIAGNLKPNQPVARPAPGFIDATQHADGRKVARQHVIFEEQLAFVLGHELAHHYLGHTGCVRSGQGTPLGNIARRLSHVGAFNWKNEVDADTRGVENLLTAGARRQGAKWTEGGALLTLEFFVRLEGNPSLLHLLGTHPHPGMARRPGVLTSANNWRASGGRWSQIVDIPSLFGG
jgi:hypothetical protein